MRSHRPITRIGELFLFSIVVGAVNLFFIDNPGFLRGPFNPYLLLALIVAAYYGKYYGLLSLVVSALVVALPFPLAASGIQPGIWGRSYWSGLLHSAAVPAAATLVSAYLIGLIRDTHVGRLAKAKEQVRSYSRQKGELLRERRIFRTVNRELEERISRQQDSITALHSEIQRLYSVNLAKALEAVLETVQRFSGASELSIWQAYPEAKELRLAACRGWSESASRPTSVPVDGSIEGWVLRNNALFSVKMLGRYDTLKEMDRGLNVMTFPLAAGHTIWGVLNIEDMPFAKYNLYTEKLVGMILALAAPALDRAVEYEAVVTQTEVHPITGLAGFAQFFSLLQNTLQRMRAERGTLSVFIVELSNYEELAEQADRESVLKLVSELAGGLLILSRNKASLFHYKDENQIAVLYPHLDYDGASLFSLETLGMINERKWKLKQRPVALEVTLGYASLSEEQVEAEGLLQIAENILEMQKV